MTTRLRKGMWAIAVMSGIAVSPEAAEPPAKPLPPANPAVAPDSLSSMLAEAKTAYARVRDYSCVFTRQELVGGAFKGEQVAELRFRAAPAAVMIRVARPEAAAGMELCWSATRADGKLRLKPSPASRQGGAVTLFPTDAKYLAEFRHSPSEIGIGRVIDVLSGISTREKGLNNPIEVFAADFQFAGRAVTRYEIFTRRPHAFRYAYRCVVCVDKETKLPIRFEAYDTPKAGGPAGGDPIEIYSFTDIKFNVGLGESVFEY